MSDNKKDGNSSNKRKIQEEDNEEPLNLKRHRGDDDSDSTGSTSSSSSNSSSDSSSTSSYEDSSACDENSSAGSFVLEKPMLNMDVSKEAESVTQQDCPGGANPSGSGLSGRGLSGVAEQVSAVCSLTTAKPQIFYSEATSTTSEVNPSEEDEDASMEEH